MQRVALLTFLIFHSTTCYAQVDLKLCAVLYKLRGFTVTAAELALQESAVEVSESELLKMIEPSHPNSLNIEIGPAKNPICLNCLYIEEVPANRPWNWRFLTSEAVKVARSLGGNPKSVYGNATKLPQADQSVDSVVLRNVLAANNAFWRAEERPQILRELYRVLKPGKSAFVLTSKHTVTNETYFNEATQKKETVQQKYSTVPESVAYRFSDIIREAKHAGFNVRIISSENHMGLELTRP